MLAARIAEDTGDAEQTLRWLREVNNLAASVNDNPARFTAQVAIVRVHRKTGTDSSDEARTQRAALIRDVDQLTARDRSRNPALIRDLAAEIGDEIPSIARDALRISGYKTVPNRDDNRREQRTANSPLTQSERGQQLTEALDPEVREEVTRTFRYESDESAF